MSKDPGNIFFSPDSVRTALALVHAGARGTTADQLQQALHLHDDPDRLRQEFANWHRQLQSICAHGHVALHSANSLWPQEGEALLEVYATLAKEFFGVVIEAVDYADPKTAAEHINTWVEAQTAQRIKDLIDPEALGALTKLVLVNAIYFKGNWAHQFDPEATDDGPFHLLDGRTVDVPFMHQKESFGYVEHDDVQFLMLPYERHDLYMQILLPGDRDGLSQLEDRLSTETITALSQHMISREVEVFLPRLTLETAYELRAPLMRLGITDAFTSGADFSGMFARQRFFIDLVVHKAFLDVNEEGTEAAAATERILFMGRVENPSV